jgi:sulfoxide reductase catalytic subunit YedY
LLDKILTSEITAEHLYRSRRKFLAVGGAAVTAAALASACRGQPSATPGDAFCTDARATATTDELGAKLTPCDNVTHYNNFYEFSLDKAGVADRARGFSTSPWTVSVGGLVARPRTSTVAELLQEFPAAERVYRLRCVEAWSMVVPWLGFPLSALLKKVEPAPSARYVRFETVFNPEQMPGQEAGSITFPYVEGLRLDEAMHDLTILATGLYGKALPVQDGAPIRLVVPWKYGFKSIKSIVKIDLVEEMPVSAWMRESPQEYGFYANVNPGVDHPRWSQASERRIGELARRSTLLFNGYAKEVAGLYAGMDLARSF